MAVAQIPGWDEAVFKVPSSTDGGPVEAPGSVVPVGGPVVPWILLLTMGALLASGTVAVASPRLRQHSVRGARAAAFASRRLVRVSRQRSGAVARGAWGTSLRGARVAVRPLGHARDWTVRVRWRQGTPRGRGAAVLVDTQASLERFFQSVGSPARDPHHPWRDVGDPFVPGPEPSGRPPGPSLSSTDTNTWSSPRTL